MKRRGAALTVDEQLKDLRQRLAQAYERVVYARHLLNHAKVEAAKSSATYNNLLSEYTSLYPGLSEEFVRYQVNRATSDFEDLQDQAFEELRQELLPPVDRLGPQKIY